MAIKFLNDINLGLNDVYAAKYWMYDGPNDNYGSMHFTDGNFHIEDADNHPLFVVEDGFLQIHKTPTIQSNLYTTDLTAIRDHYLPNASGTLALTSDLHNPVTIGTANGLSLAGQVLSLGLSSASATGALSSTDWNTFNSKANASGTTNYVPKFTGTNSLGDSQLFDNGTNVGIGTNLPQATLQVGNGTGVKSIYVTGSGTNLGLGGLSVSFLGFATGTISTVNTSGAVPLGVGTRSVQPLILGTNNTERMRIDSSGNVGIGTTSPSSKLESYKGSQSDTISRANSSAYFWGADIGLAIGQSASVPFGTWMQSLKNDNNATFPLSLNPNGSNVGIGTTNPQRKLDIVGNHNTSTFRVYYPELNVTGQDASVDIWASEPGVSYNGSGIGSNVNGQPYYGRTNPALGQGFIRFINGTTAFHNSSGDAVYSERMRITSSGNVGIGTTSPGEKLHVDGNILCTRLFIQEIDTSNVSLPIKVQGQTFMSLNNSGGLGTVLFEPYIGLNLQYTLTPLTLPHMSLSEIFTYPNPGDGMIVYNTDLSQFWAFTGGSWNPL
jgi:hypothetical protein